MLEACNKEFCSKYLNKIYPEDIILKLIKHPETTKIFKFDIHDVPYIIYSEILFPDNQSLNVIFENNWFEKFEKMKNIKIILFLLQLKKFR
jgi:hypothetical protein